MGLKSKKLNDNQSYKKSLQNSIDCAVPFTDDLFKACDNSLFKERSFLSDVNATGKILWKRPGEVTKDPHLIYREKLGPNIEVEVPTGVGPNDTILAATSAVALEKSRVYQLLPKEQRNFLHGIFKIYLWNWGHWLKVVIDDKLPTQEGQLIFSQSRCGNVFWLPVIEKALAKLYGSYELLYKNCQLTDAMSLLTGSSIETVTHMSDHKEIFRLASEELHLSSICILKTNELENTLGLLPDSHYVISAVQRPTLSMGSFRKKTKTTTAMVKLIPTKWKADEAKAVTLKRREIWLEADCISKNFTSMIICHSSDSLKKTVYGDSDSQFLFDVPPSNLLLQEFMFELTQESLHSLTEIGLDIYKVEVNRKFKLNSPNIDPCASTEKSRVRILFTRTQLKTGRYILIPCTSVESKIMIRTNCPTLRPVKIGLTSSRLVKFLPLKTPRFVTKVTIEEVSALDLGTRNLRGNLNPYCLIAIGKQNVRSAVLKNTGFHPDFEKFSALFFHSKLIPIIICLFDHKFIKDTQLSRTVIPLTAEEPFFHKTCDLVGRSSTETSPAVIIGSITISVETFDDWQKV